MFTVYLHIPEQMAYVIIKALKDMRREREVDIKHIHVEWTDGSKDLISISRGCISYKMKPDTVPFGYWVWFDLGWK
jgi:hypothetical protein